MLYEAISRLSTVFNEHILLQGQEYFEQEKVLRIRFSEGLLNGRVKGGAGQIYDVYLDLKNWPGQPARCSCSTRLNCKHAVASLLALHHARKSKTAQSAKIDQALAGLIKNLRAQKVLRRQQSVTHRLAYLIEVHTQQHEHHVVIRLALAKILKQGALGKKTMFNGLSAQCRQYFTPEDEAIVDQLIERHGPGNTFGRISLRNSGLLRDILLTGRAFFNDEQETVLQLGEQCSASAEWLLLPDGRQCMQLRHEDQVIQPLLLDKAWYFDKDKACFGFLNTPYPLRSLHYLLNVPPFSFEERDAFSRKMDQSFPEFPKPLSFQRKELHRITPKAYVRFASFPFSQLAPGRGRYHQRSAKPVFVIEVSFFYDDINVHAQEPCRKVFKLQEEVLHLYPRNESFERFKMKELSTFLAFHPSGVHEEKSLKIPSACFFVLDKVQDPSSLSALYQNVVPALKERNWQVCYDSSVYEEIIAADEVEWFSELAGGSEDFFSYRLGILIDGKPVSLVPLVVQLIGRYSSIHTLEQLPDEQRIQLPLKEGKLLEIELKRIKPLIRFLIQYGLKHIDSSSQSLKITRYQLLLAHEAEQAIAAVSSRWQGAEQLHHRLLNLTEKQRMPEVVLPKGLTVPLRDYQQEGLSWLQRLREHHFGGVLADDMGLGKTIQALALLQYEKEAGRMQRPSLLIAPTSLVGNWQAEAKRFTPQLNVLVFHGNDREQGQFERYDLIISTYGLVQRDKASFIGDSFYYLILDEAQFIKNARTKTTQIIQQIKAEQRLCLTGTPLENHLGELWSLFHFLMPGLLGDQRQFRQWFRTPIEKHADEEKKNLLSNRLKPFMLRRTKNEVAKELPPKTEMTHFIEITDAQRDLYEVIRMSMETKVQEAIARYGFNKSHMILLDALLKLRQVCCDPRLLPIPEAEIAHGHSAKLDALMTLLDNLVEEGRRVLVFSQFTSMLKLIEKELLARRYDYLKLTGKTQNRQSLVDRFQEGETPIFLISLKAGGTGLNLTRADTVIHYDPWWNPAVEDQATDRSHRIGQEHPVFVYKLITQGTVEEAILNLQKKKRRLLQTVLSAKASGMAGLSANDVANFFRPVS